MRILHIANKPAYPSHDGGCKAIAQLGEALQSIADDYRHISISTNKHPYSADLFPLSWSKFEPVSHVALDTKINPWQAFIALIKNESYHLSRFYSKELIEQTQSTLKKQKTEVVVLDSLFVCYLEPYIRAVSSARIIYRAHNIEHKIWRETASNSNWIKRIYLSHLAKQLERVESQLISKIDQIMTLTGEDARYFNLSENEVIPFAIQQNKRVQVLTHRFFHLGAMNWTPNVESVQILTKKVFPEIRKRIPSAKLRLAGSHFDGLHATSDEKNGIEILGFIDQLDEFYAHSGILLAPIVSGSGVRIKILEALSYGIPCITTTLGGAGISCEGVIKTDDWNSFIHAAIELTENRQKLQELGDAAIAYIEREHNQDKIRIKLRNLIEGIN